MGYIGNLLEKYPDKTEVELSELLENNHNIKISRANIGRVIRKLGGHIKKHFTTQNKRQEKVQEERQEYKEDISKLDTSKMVLIDEFRINLGMNKDYGRAPKGECVYNPN